MTVRDSATLKSYFQTGDKPTQVQFGDLIDTLFGVAGSTTLSALDDVTIASPGNNEVLAFDSFTGEWTNQTAAEAGLATTTHTHVFSQIDDLDEGVQDIVAGQLVAGTNIALVVDDVGGTITVNSTATPGGDVFKGGTPVAGRMAYWTGDGTLGHESGFTYDSVSNTFTITGTVIINGEEIGGLADPGADAIPFFDQSAGAGGYLTTLTGLSISGTTLSTDVTLTNSVTLTNKTLTSPEINTGTLISTVLNTGVSGTAIADITTISAGASTTTLVTPDGLGGSRYGEKEVSVALFDTDQSVAVGVSKKMIGIPSAWSGMNITGVRLYAYAAGVTGSTTVQLIRRRAGVNVNVLSVAASITTGTSGGSTVDTANDDLVTGDVLFFEVTGIHSGTAPLGLTATAVAKMP